MIRVPELRTLFYDFGTSVVVVRDRAHAKCHSLYTVLEFQAIATAQCPVWYTILGKVLSVLES